MAIQLGDLDQSHDWDEDTEVAPDPHSSGFLCRVCQIYVCMFCRPDENDDYGAATSNCAGKPWYADKEA